MEGQPRRYIVHFIQAFQSFCDNCIMNLTAPCASYRRRAINASIYYLRRSFTRPSFAPKPVLDLKHIRQNPGLYEQNSIDRNYPAYAKNGWSILALHDQLVEEQHKILRIRQRSNEINKEIGRNHGESESKSRLLNEAKDLRMQLAEFEAKEKKAHVEMERLALELPNLSSLHTPVGDCPTVLGAVNDQVPQTAGRSHVEIGKALDILDFEAGAITSGWGWYFSKKEAGMLELALVQYAMSVAIKRGWQVVMPPSLVYSHIANACGFMPRDQHGETQIYSIAQDHERAEAERSNLVLAGTAEIPLAASYANRTIDASELPLKVIGSSRSFRAEAGARGADTKGLYRVHEFTKVEMFAWTLPPTEQDDNRFGDDEAELSQSQDIFNEMLEIQTEILTSLGLHAKILEMPTTDLGASATRKVDMEAFFPSRTKINSGYGEVSSASMCTDYQSRRLGTRLKNAAGKLSWPHTINGTALAVPRVLACLLENHWDERTSSVRVPAVLQPYMPGNTGTISRN